MLTSCLACFGIAQSTKDEQRVVRASRFQKRRNSLRGNFVTKYETPIEDDYTMDEQTLGKGSFGVVVKAHKNSNCRAFAVKFISKVGYLQRIEREIKLLTDIDHANIIRLFSVYDSSTQVAFVLDLCNGGDLTSLVSRYPKKYLNEENAKVLIRQLVSAVAHIHSRGICHRDIKMQNILLENMDSKHAQIKLIDFGFATRYVGVTPMKTRCGTPYSTAPEVFRECYDERCDVWSVGVVSYYLLCGHRPFSVLELPGELKKAGKASIVTSILMGRYHFNYPAFRHVSPEGISFITKMLNPKYTSRWHASEAVKCPWLSDKFVKTAKIDLSTLKNKETPLSLAVSNLRGKQGSSTLGNTGMVAVAFDHSRYDAPEVRNLFQYFDKENAGFLSKKAFKKAMKMVSPDLSNEEIDSLFEAIDVDNDKQISFTEFLAATMDPREVDTEELSKAFALLDSNGKGFLTIDDFYRVLAVNPDRSASLQLTAKIAGSAEKDSSSNKDDSGGGVSSSGIAYFEENNSGSLDKINLLKKIALMIDAADVNKDGVLSYSEFLLGVLGFDTSIADCGAQPFSEDAALIGREKERLESLLKTTAPEQPQSFFRRQFSAANRKTVPALADANAPTSPDLSPGLGAKNPKPTRRFSFSGLRSPKTVPYNLKVEGPNMLANAIPQPLEAELGDSEVNLVGVSGYLEASQQEKPNDDDDHSNYCDSIDGAALPDGYHEVNNGLAENVKAPPQLIVEPVKGPPMWLIPAVTNSGAASPVGTERKVIRLPPII